MCTAALQQDSSQQRSPQLLYLYYTSQQTTDLICQSHTSYLTTNCSKTGLQVFALGFVSVFDQVTDGVAESADAVFKAYIAALGEDAAQYRADAEKLAAWAKGLSGADAIKPDASGDEVHIFISLCT